MSTSKHNSLDFDNQMKPYIINNVIKHATAISMHYRGCKGEISSTEVSVQLAYVRMTRGYEDVKYLLLYALEVLSVSIVC